MSEISNETLESHCDQCAVIKFYCLQKILTTKTSEKMKVVYGNIRLSRATVFSWHKMFSSGKESTELQHVAHSRRPKMASIEITVNTVRMWIEEDRSITCPEIAAIMNCSKMTIKNMKCKLWMRHMSSMWIPYHLTLAWICKDADQVEATLGWVHRTERSLLRKRSCNWIKFFAWNYSFVFGNKFFYWRRKML